MTQILNTSGSNSKDYFDLLSAKIGGSNTGMLLRVRDGVEIRGYNKKKITTKKITIGSYNEGDLEAVEVGIRGYNKGSIKKATFITIGSYNEGDLEAVEVGIRGYNKGSIKKAKFITIGSHNEGDLEAIESVEIRGYNKKKITTKKITIGSYNEGDLEAVEVGIRGHNRGSIKKAKLVIIGSYNAALVKAEQQVFLNANIRGGDVFAKEITYAGFKINAGIIDSMSRGDVITHEYEVGMVNGRRLIETLTLTCISEKEKWEINAQNVVNELTISSGDLLSKDAMLRLRYKSGELRFAISTNVVYSPRRSRRFWPFS